MIRLLVYCFGFIMVAFSAAFATAASPGELYRCDLPPGYYRPATVAEIAALRLRDSPQLESRMTGHLEPGDIVFSDGARLIRDGVTWQRIKVLQTEYWAEARSLWRAQPLTIDKTAVPVAGRCGSSDPLWSVIWTGRDFRLSLYPGSKDFEDVQAEAGASQGTALVRGANEDTDMTMIYSDSLCHDPTGKAEGWGSVAVVYRDEQGYHLLRGCCVAAREAFANR